VRWRLFCCGGVSDCVCGGSSGPPCCVVGVTVARPASRVLVLDSASHASRLCGLRLRTRTHSRTRAHDHDGPQGLPDGHLSVGDEWRCLLVERGDGALGRLALEEGAPEVLTHHRQ